MSAGTPQVLGNYLFKVATWNPVREATDREIRYVDLSSVDNQTKRITSWQTVVAQNAPSRARQLVRSGDILVSTVRPNLNGVARVPEELDGATVSTGFCVLRVDPRKLSQEYLFQWVKSPKFIEVMVQQATGASYPAVSDRIIFASSIPLPPLAEQKRIAAILDQADELRQKQLNMSERIELLDQAIFIDMFGDPASNPKALKTATLGDVIHSASDGPHVSPTYSEDGIPFLSTRHIRRGGVIWSDLKYISLKDASVHWKKCKPERGDILYTKGGTTGIAAAVDFDREIAVWVHVALLKPKHNIVRTEWLEVMLNSEHCYRQSQKFTHGIANRDLGLKRMVNITIIVPEMSCQNEFADRLGVVRGLREANSSAILKLDTLFASLQHRAFNGELTAKAAERELAEAV